MLPGFTAQVGLPSPSASMFSAVARRRSIARPAVRLADQPWSKTGSGEHQEPGGVVTCQTESTCAGVVRLCRTRCSNGEDSGWKACGGCVGAFGISLDLW